MFDGMFGPMRRDGCCNNNRECGGGGNWWWIILVVLFVCFCGCGDRDNKCWRIKFNPCTLLPILALAFCSGGFMVDRDKCC